MPDSTAGSMTGRLHQSIVIREYMIREGKAHAGHKFIPTSIGVIGEVSCHCGEKYCFSELF